MHHLLILIIALVAAGGCVSNGQRIDREAEAAHLSRAVVTGGAYRHVIYGKKSAAADPQRLIVFLDGDGRPWSADGQQPEDDPTTRNPVALKLLARTPATGIYVSRPCYQEIVDQKCSANTWTSARYSPEVVDSIAAAVRDAAQAANSREIVLVGYSGGGVLAVLVAERTEHVAAVVTIAANLDTDAWTRHHGYLPLTDSMNPAVSAREHPWPEIHLQGALDRSVPVDTTVEYFKRFPVAQQRRFDGYDHVCCWVDAWPTLFSELERDVQGQR